MYTYIQSALSLFFYNPFLFLFLSAALLVIYLSILSSCPYSSELFPFFLLEGIFYHTSRTHTGGGGNGNELRICKKTSSLWPVCPLPRIPPISTSIQKRIPFLFFFTLVIVYTGDGVLLLVPSRNPYGPLPRPPPPPHVSPVRLLCYLLFFLDPDTQSGAEQRGREGGKEGRELGEREKLGNGRGKHRDRDSRNPRMHSHTHSILISSHPRGLVFRVRIHRASLELADLGSFSFFFLFLLFSVSFGICLLL